MNTPVMTEDQIANLSDEEIMGMAIPPSAPPPEPAGSPEQPEQPAEAAQSEAEAEQETQNESETEGQETETPGSDTGVDAASGDDGDPEPANPLAAADDEELSSQPKSGEKPKSEAPAEKADGAKPEAKKDEKPAAAETAQVKEEKPPVDYKAAYEKLMGGFKANGKMIKLESVDEAVQLMQMGANYTKKLQALQPNLKLLKMLENNQLLDEGKLTYLIDLDKKNPEAIRKLIRESGVDPLDVDTSVEPSYQPGNYRVSDEEMTFNAVLEEVTSSPVGKELVITINKTWDAKSKEHLWTDPDVLRVMTEQKQNGIYDQIASEVERRQVLGQLRNEPFLSAYYKVGQEMDRDGKLVLKQQANAAPTPRPVEQAPSQVVETRVAQKKPDPNADKVKAASLTKSAPKKVTQDFNPLAMSDEDFEKHAELSKRL